MFALTALLSIFNANAISKKIAHPDELEKMTLQPGDTIRLANGKYTDVKIALNAKGSKNFPIVFMAEEAGKVTIEGASNMRIAGEFIEVHNLWFRNGYSPSGAVIEYRAGGERANSCRVTGCAIDYFNPASRDAGYSWALLFGRNNRFDHNTIAGKLNANVTLAVILSGEQDRRNFHRIDHNYFGLRPIFGANGAETIRVGTSQQAHTSSNTIIENNFFERCNGEVEVVSIKAADNIIRANTFYECQGVLALRHGNRNTVEGNLFIGNGVRNTGGVRVVNEGHSISNNVFYKLTGDRFFAALGVMNAVPNSLPNRYHWVKDVSIVRNTFVDCSNILLCVGKDNERTQAPSRVTIAGNIFYNKSSATVYEAFDSIGGFIFANNAVQTSTGTFSQSGFLEQNFQLQNLCGLQLPTAKQQGAEALTCIEKANVGAAWKSKEEENLKPASAKVIDVVAGQNTLVNAGEQANDGDTLALVSEGVYAIDNTLAISKKIAILAAASLKEKPVIRYNGAKRASLITICNGGSLGVSGVTFSGEVEPDKAAPSAAISTLNGMITPYTLQISGCEFFGFMESGFAAIRGLKNTFADSVIITGSVFRDMSAEGISFAGEKDDVGKYSVERLRVDRCNFSRMLGSAVNLYRGGNDESSAGPECSISRCTFDNVNNREQGAALRLIGVQKATVRACAFSNSGRGGAAIRFDEMRWDKISVSGCSFQNSGQVRSFWGNVEKAAVKERPCLLLTPKGIAEIKAALGKLPCFDRSYAEVKAAADKAVSEKIDVPVPADGGGGYTHEQHKRNYINMFNAGSVFQISDDEKYATYVRSMLLAYANAYATWGEHPAKKNNPSGRIFWQTLNDFVWLVHVSHAYDCIYSYLSPSDRSEIEEKLFRPMAEFIMHGNNKANEKVFNMIQNHGTWAAAAVGMIGYVMDDSELVSKALLGSRTDGKAGFLRQVDEMFSPDGYYAEGPYYLRYAIWPFMLFAQVIENNDPEQKIYQRRNAILLKAVDAEMQMMYNGEVMYLNDALKKTILTQELVWAINLAFYANPQNTKLLDIAARQQRVMICDAGIATAKALESHAVKPFESAPALLRDGANGERGAVSILRYGKEPKQTALAMKATSFGGAHGHYDKLSFSFYDNGNIILQDYGAVRFLNIEAKYGGHYTKENLSWAKQSIAHNTLTVDETSHYNGAQKTADAYWSEQLYYDVKPDIQITSAHDVHAYADVQMQRTMALITHSSLERPIAVDVFRAKSDKLHTYDLPFYYMGRLISTSVKYNADTTVQHRLGTKNGYQHLWLEASGATDKPSASFTWLNADRFYSITTLSNANSEFLFTRTGATDPDFMLRRDAAFMLRQKEAGNHTFVTVVEPHGEYNLNNEYTLGDVSGVDVLELLRNDDAYSAVSIKMKNGNTFLLLLSNANADSEAKHSISAGGRKYTWQGAYSLKIINH
ncbi:MAG: alginate lyase family protein [Prevotellaceae bacterium]|nr:alginate lyase family protein [Prevotellaceae bacterium]